MPPVPESDESLVGEARRLTGEARQQAIDELFARHYTRVARWCFRLIGQRDAAADLAQEVFLKAHRHFDSFQGQARFTTWLYAIVRNEAFSWRRRAAAAPDADADEALVDVPTADAGPEEEALAGSRRRRLQAFLVDTLDERERTVFTLHYAKEMPLDAITRLLQLENPSGAKAFIVSARRKIARAAGRVLAKGERW
jgi:RNA polymerase sigma-70 factor (ECF subfamily)